MSTFFGILAFLAFVAFIVGMVKPGIVVFWGKKKTRGMVCLYLVAMVVLTIAASSGSKNSTPAVATPPSSTPAVSQSVPEARASSVEPSSTPAPSVAKIKNYPEGMYKVGTDLPAGEYTLISDGLSYFQIAKDSTGTLESIIANDNFSGRSIVAVKNGQYLEVKGATIYAISDAPAVDISSGKLPSGMYKVGKDIKAGEYKVHSTDSTSYCEVSKNSTHTLDSIVSNDNFTGDKYITVKKGQYIKIVNAEIIIK